MARAKAPDGETREQKFKRLANQRTNRILNDLRLLGNLSNRSTYSHSTEDVQKIFKIIEEQLKTARSRFKGAKRKEFQL